MAKKRRVYKRKAHRNPPRRRASIRHYARSAYRRIKRRLRPRQNPPARLFAKKRARRHYKRNPFELGGLNFNDILKAGGSVLTEAFVEKQVSSVVLPMLPASLSSGTTGRYVVKVGSSLITWQAWRMLFGKRAGDHAGLVLGAILLSELATEFMPAITGMSGFTTPLRGFQPALRGLGRGYVSPGPVVPMDRGGSVAVLGPRRLDAMGF